jgi:ankyrin repeat protein
MVIGKHALEKALIEENQQISAGLLKQDNPLDLSDEFRELCDACRRGDLRIVHEKIAEGVNINGKDYFDYTPLILVSIFPYILCVLCVGPVLFSTDDNRQVSAVIMNWSSYFWKLELCANETHSKASAAYTMR